MHVDPDRALALAYLDPADRALIELGDRFEAERTDADRRRHARMAATCPNRLPLSGVGMTRRGGGPWRPDHPSRLSTGQRAAMVTYTRRRVVARAVGHARQLVLQRPRRTCTGGRPGGRQVASSSPGGGSDSDSDGPGEPAPAGPTDVARSGATVIA